eukprot:3247514-Pyramimonas_sp.AAC.1
MIVTFHLREAQVALNLRRVHLVNVQTTRSLRFALVFRQPRVSTQGLVVLAIAWKQLLVTYNARQAAK